MSNVHNAAEPASSPHEFVISRTLDAPRDLVWEAWTVPERLAHWWGPKGYTMLSCTADLRPGGLCHYGMRSPEGLEMWGKFVYRQIHAPESLVFVVSFSDRDGNTCRHFASPTWPLEVLNTLTLALYGGTTTLTLRAIPIHVTDEERDTFRAGFASMQRGFYGTLNQLDAYLAKAITGASP